MKFYLMPRGTGKTSSIKLLALANPDKKICVIEPNCTMAYRLQGKCPNLYCFTPTQLDNLRGRHFDYIFVDDMDSVMESLLSFYSPCPNKIATISPELGIDGPLIEGLKLK